MKALRVRIVKILMTNAECASLSTHLYTMDKWIQCDMCTDWFHLICLHENVDPEDDFVCENYC